MDSPRCEAGGQTVSSLFGRARNGPTQHFQEEMDFEEEETGRGGVQMPTWIFIPYNNFYTK